MPFRRRAFTLVELLVVVGIITVLISILMPAMSNARRQAERVKCAASLAQIGQAVSMYAGEWKGAIPVAYVWPAKDWPRGYHWSDHLAAYLQQPIGQDETAAARDRSVFWGCPAWNGRTDPFPNEHWGRSWKIGYGYNALPIAPQRPQYDQRYTMLIKKEAGGFGRYFKASQVTHASERGMIGDAFEIYIVVYYPWSPSTPIERQQYSSISPNRHGRWGSIVGVNVLYFDGHVQAVSAREAYYAFGDPIRSDPP